MERDRGQDDGIDRLVRAALKSSAAPGVGVCPDPDVLAAFGDGQLAAAERAALEPHLASCARCQTVLAMAAREADDAARAGLAEPTAVPTLAATSPRPDSPRGRWTDRFSWRWLAPAAGVAALGLILYVAVRPPAPPPSSASSPAAAPELTMASKGEGERASRMDVGEAAAESRESSAAGPDTRSGVSTAAPATRAPADTSLAGRMLPAPAEPAPGAESVDAARQAAAVTAPAAQTFAPEAPAAPAPAEAAMDVQVQAPPARTGAGAPTAMAAKAAAAPAAESRPAQTVPTAAPPAPMRAEAARDRANETLGASRAAGDTAARRDVAPAPPAGRAPDVDALWAQADLVALARAMVRPSTWDDRPDTVAFSVTDVFKTGEGVEAPTAVALWLPRQPSGRIVPGTVCVLFLQRTAVFAQPPLWVPVSGERGALRLRDAIVEPLAGGAPLGESPADLLARLRRMGPGRAPRTP